MNLNPIKFKFLSLEGLIYSYLGFYLVLSIFGLIFFSVDNSRWPSLIELFYLTTLSLSCGYGSYKAFNKKNHIFLVLPLTPVLVALVIVMFISFYHSSARSIWFDEYTMVFRLVEAWFKNVVDLSIHQQQPPLDYFSSYFFYKLFGYREFAFRVRPLLSLIFFIIFTIPLFIQENFSYQKALTSTALVIFTFFIVPKNHYYIAEARPTHFLLVMTPVLIHVFLRYREKLEGIDLFNVATFFLLCCGLQPPVFFAALFLWFVLKKKTSVREQVPLLLAVLFYLPLFYFLWKSGVKYDAIEPLVLSKTKVFSTLLTFVLSNGILIAFNIVAFFLLHFHLKQKSHAEAYNIFAMALLASIITVTSFLLFMNCPLYNRYLILTTYFFSFSLIFQILVIKKHNTKIAAFLTVVFFLANLSVTQQTLGQISNSWEPIKAVYRDILQKGTPEDKVIMLELLDAGAPPVNIWVSHEIYYDSTMGPQLIQKYRSPGERIKGTFLLHRDFTDGNQKVFAVMRYLPTGVLREALNREEIDIKISDYQNKWSLLTFNLDGSKIEKQDKWKEILKLFNQKAPSEKRSRILESLILWSFEEKDLESFQNFYSQYKSLYSESPNRLIERRASKYAKRVFKHFDKLENDLKDF